MAGLNDIISNTAQQQTTLPAWFDTAQQNVVSGAQQAYNAAPTPGQTVAQNAVNTLSGPTNPFTQAAGTLQNIATGAANPWITSPTGQITPNTNTALGGLFQAQNQQLEQLMPNITSPVTGASIGTGQFGSLRGQTAVNKAMADAQAQLFSDQMKAALQNQSTGVNAAANVGNITQQDINNLLTVGQYQQAAPFTNVSNLGKVIGGIQAPTKVLNQTQVSPLNQILGIATALGGTTGNTGLLRQLGVTGGLPGLLGGAKELLRIGSGLSPEQQPGGSGFNYGQDSTTQGALNSGMSPVDDEGYPMPGWSQSANGTWTFAGTGAGGGGGGGTGFGDDGFDLGGIGIGDSNSNSSVPFDWALKTPRFGLEDVSDPFAGLDIQF